MEVANGEQAAGGVPPGADALPAASHSVEAIEGRLGAVERRRVAVGVPPPCCRAELRRVHLVGRERLRYREEGGGRDTGGGGGGDTGG